HEPLAQHEHERGAAGDGTRLAPVARKQDARLFERTRRLDHQVGQWPSLSGGHDRPLAKARERATPTHAVGVRFIAPAGAAGHGFGTMMKFVEIDRYGPGGAPAR